MSESMTTRRRFLLALPLLCTASPGLVQAQAKLPRVGVVSPSSRESADKYPALSDAFVLGMREAHWTEGRNVAIEYRYTEGKRELLQAAVAEFVRMKVDVLFAVRPMAIAAARRTTDAIRP